MNDAVRIASVFGPWICIGIILLTIIIYLILNRKNPFLLPQKAIGWTGTALAIVIIAVAGSVFLFLNKQLKPFREIYVTTGRTIPNARFENMQDSTDFNLRDFRGHPVLLNFWATWCSPCIREMPELDRIQTKFRSQGLIVITASDEKKEILRKFMAENPMHTIEAHVDSSVYRNPVYAPIRYLRPVSFLIDSKGIIRLAIIGGQTYKSLQAMVNSILPDSTKPVNEKVLN